VEMPGTPEALSACKWLPSSSSLLQVPGFQRVVSSVRGGGARGRCCRRRLLDREWPLCSVAHGAGGYALKDLDRLR
jgi:hypothetical protein